MDTNKKINAKVQGLVWVPAKFEGNIEDESFEGWRLDAPSGFKIRRATAEYNDLGWSYTITACEDPTNVEIQISEK